ncbi:TPA: DUF551 domain-containing protein [Escherichia coli]|nr:DUF551 domain-containing protein [Escherichia coli]
MTTITKERIELFIKNPLDNGLTRGEQMELARIALASLEADPVAYIFKHPAGKLFWSLTDESNKDQSDVIPVYAAPPVPVVPEEKPMPNPLKMYAVDAVAAIAEVRGCNACRAAMLQGKSEQPQNAQQNIPENIPGGNSPVIPDGWISCSERMPNDKQYVWCWGKSYGWTEYDTFEGYYDWSRNKWWAVTDDGEEPASKVTHWMPLPEPPQEVNRG